MNLLDILLLISLGGFVLFGLWFGFVHTLGSLVGVFAGAFIAGRLHMPLADWLSSAFGNESVMRITAFFIIFFIVNRLIGFLFYLLERVVNIVARLPFINAINKLAGSIIGFIEGVLVIGLTLFIMTKYPINELITSQLQNSTLLPWFIRSSTILQTLLPEVVTQLQSIVNFSF